MSFQQAYSGKWCRGAEKRGVSLSSAPLAAGCATLGAETLEGGADGGCGSGVEAAARGGADLARLDAGAAGDGVRGRQVDDRPTGGRSAQLQRGRGAAAENPWDPGKGGRAAAPPGRAPRDDARSASAPPQPGGGTGGEGRGAAHQGSPRAGARRPEAGRERVAAGRSPFPGRAPGGTPPAGGRPGMGAPARRAADSARLDSGRAGGSRRGVGDRDLQGRARNPGPGGGSEGQARSGARGPRNDERAADSPRRDPGGDARSRAGAPGKGDPRGGGSGFADDHDRPRGGARGPAQDRRSQVTLVVLLRCCEKMTLPRAVFVETTPAAVLDLSGTHRRRGVSVGRRRLRSRRRWRRPDGAVTVRISIAPGASLRGLSRGIDFSLPLRCLARTARSPARRRPARRPRLRGGGCGSAPPGRRSTRRERSAGGAGGGRRGGARHPPGNRQTPGGGGARRELSPTGAAHDVLDRALAVDQPEQAFQPLVELLLRLAAGAGEDRLRAADVLADQPPLVDPLVALHEDVVGVDREVRQLLRQEVAVEEEEAAAGEAEDGVEDLLDLVLDPPPEAGGVDQLALQEHGAEALAGNQVALGFGERLARQLAHPVEDLAEPVLGLVAGREGDLAAAEPDRLLDRVARHGQEAGPAAHVEEREEVGDAETPQAAGEGEALGLPERRRPEVGAHQMQRARPVGEDEEGLRPEQAQLAHHRAGQRGLAGELDDGGALGGWGRDGSGGEERLREGLGNRLNGHARASVSRQPWTTKPLRPSAAVSVLAVRRRLAAAWEKTAGWRSVPRVRLATTASERVRSGTLTRLPRSSRAWKKPRARSPGWKRARAVPGRWVKGFDSCAVCTSSSAFLRISWRMVTIPRQRPAGSVTISGSYWFSRGRDRASRARERTWTSSVTTRGSGLATASAGFFW